MENEVWKDIKGYEGLYQISNLGRVKRLCEWVGNKYAKKYVKKQSILKGTLDNVGYITVTLSKNSKNKKYRVHRLVSQFFIPNPDNFPQVNHIDGNKQNNNVNNLEWCDNNYNIHHAIKNGLWGHRSDNIKKKVNQYDINNIYINSYESITEAEKKLGINNTSISQCCKGKRKTAGGYIWKYVETI